MKNKIPSLFLLVGVLACALSSGCVSYTKTTVDDAPAFPVKFESAQAAQTFYDAVLAKYFPDKVNEKSSISLYFVPPYMSEENVRKSSRVIVNAAVAEADTNHDGTITQAEADAYAAAKEAIPQKEDDDKAKDKK